MDRLRLQAFRDVCVGKEARLRVRGGQRVCVRARDEVRAAGAASSASATAAKARLRGHAGVMRGVYVCRLQASTVLECVRELQLYLCATTAATVQADISTSGCGKGLTDNVTQRYRR